MVVIEDIRARARDLLESGKVRAVLGYSRNSAGLLAEPAFVTAPEEVDALVWDATCAPNLALYLVSHRKRQRTQRDPDTRPLAVIAKGCDSRAVNVLIQENQIERKDVVILGVSCEGGGVVDTRKLAMALDGDIATSAAWDGAGAIKTATSGGESALPAADVLADRCLECAKAYPTESDAFFGEKVDERGYAPRFAAVEAVANMTAEARSALWDYHFARCIRCYACRAVCPMCYCDECVVDSTSFVATPTTTAEDKANRIRWIERSATPSENAMYHLVRAIHLAGRCIDCAECERVCPVNIPLRLLNTMLEREALEMFDYAAGADPAQPSLISSFRDGDPNDFIR